MLWSSDDGAGGSMCKRAPHMAVGWRPQFFTMWDFFKSVLVTFSSFFIQSELFKRETDRPRRKVQCFMTYN